MSGKELLAQRLGSVTAQLSLEVAAHVDLIAEKDARIAELEAEVAALKPKPETVEAGGEAPPVVVFRADAA